jgi:hypothetical protein
MQQSMKRSVAGMSNASGIHKGLDVARPPAYAAGRFRTFR